MGCAGNGDLDDSSYSSRVPWVGLYIASASFLCALAMASDAFTGLRHDKRWFPSNYFTLNATTLTLIGIATKHAVDRTSPMSGSVDQLSKLSGTALLSTAIANFLPSLGDTPDAASNVIALVILVITVTVNIAIQIGTGVIYVFLPEHIAVLFLNLVLLLILCSSTITIATTKHLLETQFDSKHAAASDSVTTQNLNAPAALSEFVKHYWLMAHTSSPQFVLGRSTTCTASGAFCLLSAAILMETILRSTIKESFKFYSGDSDFKWSTMAVVFSQAFAVAVGTFAPAYRWLNAVNFRSPQRGEWSFREEFRVEEYWVQSLVEVRDSPLTFEISSRRMRKTAHQIKRLILGALIGLQSGVVVICKLVRLASVLPVSWFNRSWRLARGTNSIPEQHPVSGFDMSHFVVHLEGERDLVRAIMKSGRRDVEKWIVKGSKNQPEHLVELIKKHSTASYGFRLTCQFDSERVPSLVHEEPPNCWALPLVTLTSIAIALGGGSTEVLINGVSEGLKYIRLVEKHLDAKGLVNTRHAADLVWLGVDLYDRWFNEDLRRLAAREKSGKRVIEWIGDEAKECVVEFLGGKKVIEKLGDVAKECVVEFLGKMGNGDEDTGNDHMRWPKKVLAANCMYRISRTILLECDENPRTDEDLFLWLQSIISDILGACLTNLPRVIYMECFCSAIEVREKSVREAALLLGEAENVLKILGEEEVMCLYPERRDYIDDWRRTTLINYSSPHSTSNKLGCFTSDELTVRID